MSDDPPFRNSERRHEPRLGARVAVKFHAVEHAAKALSTFSLNISSGGLCLRTKNAHAVGDALALSITIEGEAFELKGVVAWTKADVIGIRFVDLTPTDRARLEAVAKVLAKTSEVVA